MTRGRQCVLHSDTQPIRSGSLEPIGIDVSGERRAPEWAFKKESRPVRSRCGALAVVMPSEKLAVEIRREFFEDISGHVDANLRPKLCHGVCRVSVVLVICVRNRYRSRVAENLRIIELHAARIGMSPESLTDRVSQP